MSEIECPTQLVARMKSFVQKCAMLPSEQRHIGFHPYDEAREIAAMISFSPTMLEPDLGRWALVPVRMTQEMEDAWRNSPGLSCSVAYTAMLEAVDYSGLHGSTGIPVDVRALASGAKPSIHSMPLAPTPASKGETE